MDISSLIALVLALLPTCVIMFLVLRNAKYKKEPAKKILQVFGISVLSVIPAIIFELMGESIWDVIFVSFLHQSGGAILYEFVKYVFIVGICEELCKFFTFRWIIFNDRQFDNTYDGVIYGAASALGFATLENLMYVFLLGDLIGTAILRALLSVPMHAVTGIVMGYYFGISKYRIYNNIKPKSHPEIPALIFSIILHGIYDFVATLPEIDEDDDTVFIMSMVIILLIMIGIYILMGITIRRAKAEKHNIYNRYYYEQLDGHFQDMWGRKTRAEKVFFGVPIFYNRQPGGFNPYNPYMNIPPVRQYNQPYNQPYQPVGQPTQPYIQQHSQPQPQYAHQTQNMGQASQQAQTAAPPAPAVKYCGMCGAKTEGDSKFCPECGNPFIRG